MKFVIDTKKLEESNISIDVLMYLMALYLRSPITSKTIETLHKTNYIYYGKVEGGLPAEIDLLEEGAEILEEVFLNSELEKTVEDKDRYTKLAESMMKIFPEGKKAGTIHYWKGNTKDISRRLKKFFKVYGDKPDEDILSATKRYIESFNGNYQYMKILKYFIWKDERKLNEDGIIYVDTTSALADVLENKDTLTKRDWINTLR